MRFPHRKDFRTKSLKAPDVMRYPEFFYGSTSGLDHGGVSHQISKLRIIKYYKGNPQD